MNKVKKSITVLIYMNYDAATISSYWDILFRQSDFHSAIVP